MSCPRSTASAWVTSLSTTASPICSASCSHAPAPPPTPATCSARAPWTTGNGGRRTHPFSPASSTRMRTPLLPASAQRPAPLTAAPTTPATPTTLACRAYSTASPPSSTIALTRLANHPAPGSSLRDGGAVLFRAYSPDALERGTERERAAVADLLCHRTD